MLDGIAAFAAGVINQEALDALTAQAVRDTIQLLEKTGSPVITDGEQSKPSFATYPVHGLPNLAPDGIQIQFSDGHVRQLPRLTSGPFRYKIYAEHYLLEAKKYAQVPVKQAVIAASALSLLYPQDGIADYPKEDFLQDLVNEAEADIRRCLDRGAHCVQVDFTEGRLSVKLDPSLNLLRDFIQLNNRVLERFSAGERKKIGVHTCPGADKDSTHSADVDYAELLPDLFELKAGNFYIALASEKDRRRVLGIIKKYSKPEQRIFIGVIDPINPHIETPEQVKQQILEAAEFIPAERLGTTDDCGFSPFGDDTSRSRQIALEKITNRVLGTALAAKALGL
ncbi:MAG: 5-methyltetrahydropteroyltriglutamate--homocysteine methyltransferase [Methylobacter sp.]|nr:5-methyltetrahydropteroyltriglutamate--homocysteine methyltransferase [Methylobacter sp.]